MSAPNGLGLQQASTVLRPRAASILLAVSVTLYAGTWPVLKLALADATPLWYAAARAILTSVVCAALLAVLGRLRVPSLHDWPMVASIGAFQMAAFYACSNLGLERVDAGRAVIVAYTTTLWIVPVSALIGERLGPRVWLGALMGLAGVAVVIEPWRIDWSNLSVLAGFGWLSMAALSWAIGIVHSRRHVWHARTLDLMPWQTAVAALCLTPLAAVLEPDGHLGGSALSWGALIYVAAIVGPFGSWAATSIARSLPSVVTSLGYLGVPLGGFVGSALWLGEPVTLPVVVGGALILAGVATVSTAGGTAR